MKGSMDVSADELGRIGELYDRGMYLQAWQASTRVGPLREWRGTSARVLAGRLAGNLGAQRLGRVLHFRAWRDDREDLEALYSYAYAILDRRGPLDAWVLLRAGGDFAAAPEPLRADLYALRAEVAALLRDFDTADHWLGRAEKIAADRAWFHVARARILEHEDRYPDALAAVRRALDLRPWYRPAVQTMGHLLQLLDRDPEALAFLREASRRIESGAVAVQLAALEVELGHHAEARLTCERIEQLYPLLENEMRMWLHARKCDTAYACGDHAAAREWASKIDNPFYQRFAERLGAGQTDGRRVQLPVGFVRQHHMTCAPATLSAHQPLLGMPAEHLEVAEEICYDGTPAHSERQWAEQNGWVAREFTVTWDGAVRAARPRHPVHAHDRRAGQRPPPGGHRLRQPPRHAASSATPTSATTASSIAEQLFERYKSTGPRGMALVPRAKAATCSTASSCPTRRCTTCSTRSSGRW